MSLDIWIDEEHNCQRCGKRPMKDNPVITLRSRTRRGFQVEDVISIHSNCLHKKYIALLAERASDAMKERNLLKLKHEPEEFVGEVFDKITGKIDKAFEKVSKS